MDFDSAGRKQLLASRREFLQGTLGVAGLAALGIPLRVAYASSGPPTIRNFSSISGFDDPVFLPEPVVGNAIYVFVFSIAPVTSGITDSAGNTYTFLKNQADSNSNYTAVFRAPVTVSGSGTLEIMTEHGGLCALEIANDNGVDAAVTTGTYASNSGGTLSAGAITTTVADDLILSAAYDQNNATLSASTGTLVITGSSSADMAIVQAHTTTSTGSYTESFTIPASYGETASMIAIAIKGGGTPGGWQLPTGHYVPHVQPLQIIAPRAGLTTGNVYYQAYPGIALNLPVAVVGGAWPFQYKVLSGPLSVGQHYGDPNYGVLTWASPTAGTYSCEVEVTDQEGTVATVSWTLTVTTNNFIFVDATNGHPSAANGGGGTAGTGTLANPYQSLNDWYAGATGGTGSGTRFDATYKSYFVIYRAGTYDMASCFTDSNGLVEMGQKPTVHLAYPGEAVVLSPLSGSEWSFSGRGNIAICGMTCPGIPNGPDVYQWIEIDSGTTDHLFYGNTLEPPASGSGITGNNPAFIKYGQNGTALAQYIAFIGNTIQGTTGYEIVEAYNTQYFVIEGNTVQGNTAQGFFAKIGNSNWTVRANTGTSGNTGSLVTADGYSPAASSIEVCWNLYLTSGNGWFVGPNPTGPIGPLWSNRNTWVVGAQALANDAATMTVVDDVVQFSGTANAHGWSITGGGSFTSSSFTGEDAVGAGPFVDSSGNLTGTYTSLLGTRGYQVA